MVLHALVVQHEGGGTSYTVDYDSDDGEETLKVQLFSLTGVLPENQKLVGLSDIRNGQRFLTLVEKEEEQQERTISQDPSTGISPALDLKRIAILDEELARALELEDAVHANSIRRRGRLLTQDPSGKPLNLNCCPTFTDGRCMKM